LPKVKTATSDAPDHGKIVKVMAHVMPQLHLSRHPLDDEISHRWFENFLEALDPRRMYFTRQDVARFAKSRDQLDELAKRGDIALPLSMRDTLMERVAQTTIWGREFARAKHDFTLEETCTVQHADFAADLGQLRERWRKQIKYELLLSKADGVEGAKAFEHLDTRYSRLRARGMNDEELIETFLSALAKSYDPHSEYLHEDTLRIFMQ
jgi:carboxyl-terminal processing protease